VPNPLEPSITKPRSEPRRRRGPALAAVLLAGAVPALVYARTVHPGLPAGDSGELITAARVLGVAHPPGYPLYVLLAHAWASLVPPGTVAFRLNLFSLALSVGAVMLLAHAVHRLTRSVAAALVAGWALAFAAPFWKLALAAEVFALSSLLAAAILVAFVHLLDHAGLGGGPAPERPRPWPLLLLVFLTGLIPAHHHTLVLLALPVDLTAALLLVLPEARLQPLLPGFRRPYRLRTRDAALLGAVFVAGLSVLVYLPIAAARHPALNWGDPEGWRSFLRLLLRMDYGTLHLDPRAAGLTADRSHALLYVLSVWRDLTPLGTALAVLGLGVAAGRRRALVPVLAGFLLLQALFFTRVGFPTRPAVYLGVVERFYILPDLVLAFAAGLGAAWLLARLPRRAVPVSAALLALLAGGWPVAAHGRLVNQRGNTYTGDLARNVLASLPPGAVLFTQGDIFHNGLAYLTLVEGERPDVTVVDQELLTMGWYVREVRRRHPGLLPPLGGGERVRLTDGRVLEGKILGRVPGGLRFMTPDSLVRLDSTSIARVERDVPPESLFVARKRAYRNTALVPPAADRYSGLPGTLNVLWLDHLRGKRPAAFIGVKETSYALRYDLVPRGFVDLAVPKGTAPGLGEQAAEALREMAGFRLESRLRRYDPTSFEAENLRRVDDVVVRTALLLCQPEASELRPESYPGFAKLLAYLDGYPDRAQRPEPRVIRAAGLLYALNPQVRDPERARRELTRYLAGDPTGPEADEARRTLAGL
jgi:hypothetical protein